jgi:two-component system, NtrC family, response regulator AtoC
VTVSNALEGGRLRDENKSLKKAVEVRHQMVGESHALKQVMAAVSRAAPTNATVLITGESGVGKELVARAIHQRSPRKERPFVKVNCAALPAELLESELFGHEKGAFTGAALTRIGKFEQADTGTIFLDEIGEVQASLQAKLLHVLQDAQFTKLGSNKSIDVDVRIVAATNRNLESMMLRGEFREDLYYRLKVIEITVPPLRERRGEIAHLTGFFIDRYARRYNRSPRQLSAELAQLFQTYEWPGNIRELENMIKRIVILQDEQLVIREMTKAGRPVAAYAAAGVAAGSGVLTAPVEPFHPDVDDEEPHVEEAPATAPAGSRLADVAKAASMKAERALIEDTLQQMHWNRRRAAEQLGVSYKTLLNKIKECGISRK